MEVKKIWSMLLIRRMLVLYLVGPLLLIAERMSYGYVSKNLSSMLEETNPYEKSQLIKSITNEINVISSPKYFTVQ